MATSRISSTFLFPIISFFFIAASANFYKDVDITWGGQRSQILDGGNLLTLSLDRSSGAGFASKNDFLFGQFHVQMKLVTGDSAGTVTTFYLSSQGPKHDEIDFEFLGNSSGSPYTLHTNVFINGQGGREEQFRLWFDPTADFHTYSIVWNPQNIIILVDKVPIRVFGNEERNGIPYPRRQRMRVYSSLWAGEEWATQGGRVKTDWSKAPFIAYYRDFSAQNGWQIQGLDANGRKLLKWVQKHHRIYYYCHDLERVRHYGGRPVECRRPSVHHK